MAQLTFLDGVCEARPRDVARSLVRLRSNPSPLLTLTALCNRLRPALYMICFPREEARALDAIGAPRERALNMARSARKHFGPDAIKKFMMGALRCSFLEKTSLAEGWPGFEVLLWELLGSSAGSTAPGKQKNTKR